MNHLLEPDDIVILVPVLRVLSNIATAALDDLARTCLMRGSFQGRQGIPVLLTLAVPW